jgi:hypothetical protein
MFAQPQRVTNISIEKTTSRMLAGSVLLAAACLFAPGQAHAQSIAAQQALGNVSTFVPFAMGTITSAPSRATEGASALLGGSPASTRREASVAPTTPEAVRPVEGAQALLGQAWTSGPVSR